MRVTEVVESLRRTYPGRKIILLPDKDNPKEIICEIDPAAWHPLYSVAIAVIDESEPHYDRKSKESYYVEEGRLTLFVDGEKYFLGEGDCFAVLPGQVHWAKGSPARVKVVSTPGWTAENHIPVKPAK